MSGLIASTSAPRRQAALEARQFIGYAGDKLLSTGGKPGGVDFAAYALRLP
jgi:hypothetical protein